MQRLIQKKKRFTSIKESAESAILLRDSLENKVKHLEEQLKTERKRYTEQVDEKRKNY